MSTIRPRDGIVRLKRFHVEECRRRVEQIETMIGDFKRRVADLEEQIQAEQERSGIHDADHFAYPTFAKAAAQRRDNLKASAAALEAQFDAAKMELDAAMEELAKSETLAGRDEATVQEAKRSGRR